MKRICAIVFCLVCIMTGISFAAVDVTAPELNNVSFYPSSVNAGDNVTIIVEASDDLSGIVSIGVTIHSPSNVNTSNMNNQIELTYVSKDKYSGTFNVPQFAENGMWQVYSIGIYDNAGNYKIYVNGVDFNGAFEVISQTPDMTAPVLKSVSVPSSVVYAGHEVTIDVEAEDDISGVAKILVNLQGPSKYNTSSLNGSVSLAHVSGNKYSGMLKLSEFAEGGIWKLCSIVLYDNVNNFTHYMNGVDYNAEFEVIASNPDTTAPVLNSVSVSPESVDTGKDLILTVEAQDDLSGVEHVIVRIQSPSNYDRSHVNAEIFLNHVSGNKYSATFKMPRLAEDGIWRVYSVILGDKVDNYKTYVTGADFNTTFTVNVTNNFPPIAKAVKNLVADANQEVELDASDSYDPDGRIITYTWKRLPHGDQLYSGPEPIYTIKAFGFVEEAFELTVTDDKGESGSDTTIIVNKTVDELRKRIEALEKVLHVYPDGSLALVLDEGALNISESNGILVMEKGPVPTEDNNILWGSGTINIPSQPVCELQDVVSAEIDPALLQDVSGVSAGGQEAVNTEPAADNENNNILLPADEVVVAQPEQNSVSGNVISVIAETEKVDVTASVEQQPEAVESAPQPVSSEPGLIEIIVNIGKDIYKSLEKNFNRFLNNFKIRK